MGTGRPRYQERIKWELASFTSWFQAMVCISPLVLQKHLMTAFDAISKTELNCVYQVIYLTLQFHGKTRGRKKCVWGGGGGNVCEERNYIK
jgi:hypothetical protein